MVTDLQMPQMDGFALLAHLSENYPDIPVIILTAYGSQTSRKAALEGGAAGFIEKPFVVEKMAAMITETLKRESEGGILQTVPLDMFLQLIEMEQKTCTIRVVNKSSDSTGVLFFKSGILIDARVKAVKGTLAAYEIFSWEKVTLAIQDTCTVEKKQIKDDLQAILMEAMRLKDEADKVPLHRADATEPASIEIKDKSDSVKPIQSKKSDPVKPIQPKKSDPVQEKLNRLSREKPWLKNIDQDNRWDDLIGQLRDFGAVFNSGKLKSCYINIGRGTDFIVLPGENTYLISVDKKCPREQVLHMLAE